jgi:hypothetical protein
MLKKANEHKEGHTERNNFSLVWGEKGRNALFFFENEWTNTDEGRKKRVFSTVLSRDYQ